MRNPPDSDAAALKRELELGVAAARDPVNAAAMQGGRATTTLLSRWLHLRCAECGHSFRVGDAVAVSAEDGSARHDSVSLPCAHTTTPAAHAPVDAAAFFAGLEEAWPPPRDLPVHRLLEGHPLLAPPQGGFRRHGCAVCGHTLRPNDCVILCPCSPGQPACRVAIHRDPVHGLHCWEAWNPGASRRHCPATSRLIGG
jgi:hypothetical protein